jgi:hypothetical protein
MDRGTENGARGGFIMAAPTIADSVIAKLAVHLGPNVAKMSLKGFLKKAGIATPDLLTAAQIPALVEEIRPMLNVMIGKEATQIVLAEISALGR